MPTLYHKDDNGNWFIASTYYAIVCRLAIAYRRLGSPKESHMLAILLDPRIDPSFGGYRRQPL